MNDRRAMAVVERREARSAPREPGDAIAFALALVALSGRLHGWPVPDDPVSMREDDLARVSWAKLRLALENRGRSG